MSVCTATAGYYWFEYKPDAKKNIKGQYMFDITIILKSGKEVNFTATEEELQKDIITAYDGTNYTICSSEIVATIRKECVRCPNCGKWIIRSNIRSGMCPECGKYIR